MIHSSDDTKVDLNIGISDVLIVNKSIIEKYDPPYNKINKTKR